MKVLVIDDEEMIRSLAEKILRRGGYEVLSAETGEEAIEAFARAEDIDGVLLDMSMPGMSGLETLRRLRAIREDIPCVLSSGQPESNVSIDDTLRNRTSYLEKPYRAQALIKAIDELLK